MYRVGIIGCGWIAVDANDNHYEAYLKNPKVGSVMLCDINGQEIFDDYMEMVKNCDLDIVSVCTPVEKHCKIVCDVAPYVKAIYCEKPIAETLEDADKMIETCHKHNVVLQINHQRLFMNPKFRFSRDIIGTGTHVFSLIDHLFKPEIKVDIEYVPMINENIFELDCTHTKEPMIPKGVEHLIDCLENHHESISSGELARDSLFKCLKLQEEINTEHILKGEIPYINCPYCGNHQKAIKIPEVFKVGRESWCFEFLCMNCEKSFMMSDYYAYYIWE